MIGSKHANDEILKNDKKNEEKKTENVGDCGEKLLWMEVRYSKKRQDFQLSLIKNDFITNISSKY